MATAEVVDEEHYVLRILDTELADALRGRLRESDAAVPSETQLIFEDSDRTGKFVFQGKEYPVTVLDLPCVTETYKTYDDVNLVKAADVGQVLVVGDAAGLAAQEHEARDGITPPMRNPRARVFRKQLDADPAVVQGVEVQLLTILGGGAPQGVKFVDYEEVWRINEATGQGEWVPVTE